jgi:hypothetical protein
LKLERERKTVGLWCQTTWSTSLEPEIVQEHQRSLTWAFTEWHLSMDAWSCVPWFFSKLTLQEQFSDKDNNYIYKHTIPGT